MTQWSESALVKRMLAGDREACVELIRLYHAPIYRLLVHLAGDAHLAEDLTQESFLAAWKKIGSFKANSSLGTWLHTIAYRKFIDARRRGGRLAEPTDDARLVQAPSSAAAPAARASANDEAQRLHRAIDRLPAAQRDVIVLHYLQGLSYEEMAAVLDQPSGTVKWRTRQALENLRSMLGGQDAK